MSSIDELSTAIGAAADAVESVSTAIGAAKSTSDQLHGRFSALGTEDKAG